MSNLKIYKVEAPGGYGGCGGYDTYSEFVVCAENEDEARDTHPEGYKMSEGRDFCEWSWVSKTKLNDLDVTYLGDAAKGIEKGVIVASYHAG